MSLKYKKKDWVVMTEDNATHFDNLSLPTFEKVTLVIMRRFSEDEPDEVRAWHPYYLRGTSLETPMSKKPKKRRPEIMNPGLKQLTPYEKRLAERVNKADRDRWNELMAKPWNKWQPVK